MPTTGGTYTVVDFNQINSDPTTGHVAISFYDNGNTYNSTGFGSNLSVQILVSPAGKITISGNNIELKASATDSGAVSFTMAQDM